LNYKELKIKKDLEIKELAENNYSLKFQVDQLTSQIMSFQNQEAQLSDARNQVINFKSMLQEKEREIERLKSGDNFQRGDNQLLRMQMQLNKALLEIKKKDKELETLKKEFEDFTRQMDKNAAVMDNLKQTVQENSKILSTNNQYNLNKQFEQKITFYENRLRESESRVRDLEEQAAVKEKELIEALTRMREYESGDYQLQQAVAEIKSLKNQIKVRDRDIERLVGNVNKLDVMLTEVMDENEDFRAKLGMKPMEKLNLDEMNNLRAIRAQENRVQIYLLQRENENLVEVQTQLRGQIYRLAKQIRSKEVVANILEDENYDYSDMIESKLNNKQAKPGEKQGEIDPKIIKENDLMKRRNEHLLEILLEYENENKMLKKGIVEINDQINEANMKNSKRGRYGKDNVIKCPALEKLLSEMEAHGAIRSNMKAYSFLNKILLEGGGADAVNLALKSEIDYLLGRNEELRNQILQQRAEIKNSNKSVTLLQDEVDKLKGDVRLMNHTSAAKDIFHPFKLPDGMAPSSQDIISALNEYLIDTLQELDEYKKLGTMAEGELEKLKRKYAVARHQISILYRDYIDEKKEWKKEKEALNEFVKKLNDTIAIDSVKLQEYDRLLEVLQKDEPEIRRIVAENSRQMYMIRENEKKLQRKCLAYEESNAAIMKENKKVKVDLIETEIAVQQRIGYLERYKDLAHFRIISLQRQLEESVSIVKLEKVNKEYDQVVHKYRQLLDKQEKSDELTTSLHQTEQLNKKYENEIEFLKRELENQKDKANIFEETLNRMKALTIPPVYGSTSAGAGPSMSAIDHDNSIISMSKRLTALEMKELNERQKADHAQRMYDQQRNLIRLVHKYMLIKIVVLI
jgi:centrosomal protein CEP290